VASDNQSMKYQVKSKRQLTHNFYFNVHVLAGTLVSVVKADSLGGSRANRHHV
jgi:hypothetical protein